jgi:hypothetical protein
MLLLLHTAVGPPGGKERAAVSAGVICCLGHLHDAHTRPHRKLLQLLKCGGPLLASRLHRMPFQSISLCQVSPLTHLTPYLPTATRCVGQVPSIATSHL